MVLSFFHQLCDMAREDPITFHTRSSRMLTLRHRRQNEGLDFVAEFIMEVLMTTCLDTHRSILPSLCSRPWLGPCVPNGSTIRRAQKAHEASAGLEGKLESSVGQARRVPMFMLS